MLSSLQGIVIVGDEVTHDGQVGEFKTPTSPVADAPERPTFVCGVPLATSTPERVSAIRLRIDHEIHEIVAKELEKSLRRLKSFRKATDRA